MTASGTETTKQCLLCRTSVLVGQKKTYRLAACYEGEIVCRECARRYTNPCIECGERVALVRTSTRPDTYVQTSNGVFCKTCAETKNLCPQCGRTRNKTIDLKDRTGKSSQVCASCFPMDNGYNWDYNPRQMNYHGDYEKEGSFYGIELETDGYNERGGAIKYLHKFHATLDSPTFWLKPDGSLRNGIEICFHPRTISAWVELLTGDIFPAMREIINKYGGKSYDTSSSGLHIHREIVGITEELKAKLAMFFAHNKKQLQKIAQRGSGSYCSYSPYDPTSLKTVNATMSAVKNRLGGRNALTLTSHHKTVEFRIFKGTLVPKTIAAQVGFTDAMLTWLDSHPASVFDELIQYKSTWEKFMVDLQTFDSPATPYIHELLNRKRFYSISIIE